MYLADMLFFAALWAYSFFIGYMFACFSLSVVFFLILYSDHKTRGLYTIKKANKLLNLNVGLFTTNKQPFEKIKKGM
jgi:hypothetical protein